MFSSLNSNKDRICGFVLLYYSFHLKLLDGHFSCIPYFMSFFLKNFKIIVQRIASSFFSN